MSGISPASHTFGPVLARVRRDALTGLTELTLIADDDPVELADGDTFVTAMFVVDPFAPPAG